VNRQKAQLKDILRILNYCHQHQEKVKWNSLK